MPGHYLSSSNIAQNWSRNNTVLFPDNNPAIKISGSAPILWTPKKGHNNLEEAYCPCPYEMNTGSCTYQRPRSVHLLFFEVSHVLFAIPGAENLSSK